MIGFSFKQRTSDLDMFSEVTAGFGPRCSFLFEFDFESKLVRSESDGWISAVSQVCRAGTRWTGGEYR